MFLRKIKTPQKTTYYHLVESYRENGKVRQRTLLSLGRTDEGKLEQLAKAIEKHTNLITAEELARQLCIDQTFILGPLLILQRVFEKTGINEAIENLPRSKKAAFDIKKTLFTMVVSRFVSPGSKLKVFEHWQNTFYPGILEPNIKLHQFYRTLDFLSTHKDTIERSLYWKGRNLFNMEVDVVLYDLTTLRFESVREDLGDLRRFGYSKEKRNDCVQVVLGLLVDNQGIPLGFEVYPGNTFEGKTVSDIASKIRKKFNVRRFIFVGDRGLFSDENMKIFKKDREEFIIGMKLGMFQKRREEFYNKDLFHKVSEDFFVYETEHERQRLVVTWSRKRAERDRKKREAVLSKIKEKLGKKGCKGKSFVTNSSYKKYVCFPKGGNKKPCLDEERIKEEERKDGFFGIVTNAKGMKAEELIFNYKELWRVEDAFGEIKGTLRARPVFHWTDKRIKGHLMVCFLGYLCEAYLTRELRKKRLRLKSEAVERGVIRSRALTVVEAMRELSEVRAVPVEMKGRKIWIRTEIRGNAAAIFKAAGVQIPKKLLKIEGEERKKRNREV